MSIFIKYFQPSWFQIKNRDKIIYIDPAYLKKYCTKYGGVLNSASLRSPKLPLATSFIRKTLYENARFKKVSSNGKR